LEDQVATRIGVDVGGTFTDLIFLDDETGQVRVGKGPSNPHAVDAAVQAVVAGALGEDDLKRSEYFLHGTTVGLNALLERKGARVGLITTEGFRDVLEVRRLMRVDENGEHVWRHLFKTPAPLVARPLRIGVEERTLADGSVRTPLSAEDVRAAAEVFAREGVECVAIVFLNAHRNPAHEIEAAEVLRDAGFGGPVSLSHQVTGQYREFERASTTVIDAYVRPAVSAYLERLESGLAEDGFSGECLITTSSGGCVTFTEARSRPFETVMSGPVAGAVGASTLCKQLGIKLAITGDVGGTSFDTALLVDGRPQVKYEGAVVGMPLQTPWVDVRSVGAGGGSIAYVDQGLLHVGPRSAGAVPGPVCYGRGGTEPTVTDAAVALGMMARPTLASGLMLDEEAARDAISRIAEELGLDADEAAQGVLRVAGASMAGAMRAVSVEVGEDPREGALIAYGGAGPLLASLLARELAIGMVVIPNHAGNFSAWGLLGQDVVRSAALTIVATLDGDGIARSEETLRKLFGALEERLDRRLAGTVSHELEFDMRYPGQEYTMTVKVGLDGDRIAEASDVIGARFAAAYERSYGHSFPGAVEIESVRAIERTSLPNPAAAAGAPDGSPEAASAGEPQTSRAFSFQRGEWCDFTVIDRTSLRPGDSFDGPAILLETTTTSYIDDGFHADVHATGTVVLTDTLATDRDSSSETGQRRGTRLTV
jgi:N-methylhydantoinase A